MQHSQQFSDVQQSFNIFIHLLKTHLNNTLTNIFSRFRFKPISAEHIFLSERTSSELVLRRGLQDGSPAYRLQLLSYRSPGHISRRTKVIYLNVIATLVRVGVNTKINTHIYKIISRILKNKISVLRAPSKLSECLYVLWTYEFTNCLNYSYNIFQSIRFLCVCVRARFHFLLFKKNVFPCLPLKFTFYLRLLNYFHFLPQWLYTLMLLESV